MLMFNCPISITDATDLMVFFFDVLCSISSLTKIFKTIRSNMTSKYFVLSCRVFDIGSICMVLCTILLVDLKLNIFVIN